MKYNNNQSKISENTQKYSKILKNTLIKKCQNQLGIS